MERAELAAFCRQQYDATAAQQSGVILDVYRTWIVFNLLYMLHDSNLPSAALRANKMATPDVVGITSFASRFAPSVFDACAGTFPSSLGSFGVYRPPDRWVTATGRITSDGTDTQTDPLAAWDTTIREQRFDIVDAILGDRTPGRTAA